MDDIWLFGYGSLMWNPALHLAAHGLRHAGQSRSDAGAGSRRELFTGAYRSRWVLAETGSGPIRATTFVVNRDYPRYAGRLPDRQIADRIASATGTLGNNISYLEQAADALRQRGSRDHGMDRRRAMIDARS